jgi:hypothetical protein
MALTSEQWYNLGYRMGNVDKCLTRMMFTLQSKYGKSNSYAKLLFNLYGKSLCGLQSNLDDLICQAYPMSIHSLLSHPNIPLTDVFYNVNRFSCEEANSFVQDLRPHPKCLTCEEVLIFKQAITFIITYFNEVDTFFFKGKNKHIMKFREVLTKLDLFLQPMSGYETNTVEEPVRDNVGNVGKVTITIIKRDKTLIERET